MSLVPASYEPPAFLKSSGHALTMFPFFFRRQAGLPYQRERIETPDQDFLDVDWVRRGNTRVAVLCHGMEGSSRSTYIRGMAKALVEEGWDVAAMNFRGCSGEANRTARLYHGGATEDLDVVLRRVMDEPAYSVVALVGFSLGGNLILKYLGEKGSSVDPRIKSAVTFSVPCDLASSTAQLDRLGNRLYRTDFTRSMSRKLKAKAARYPGLRTALCNLNARGFDACYIAPYHGFGSAEEYWRLCSSKRYLRAIAVPTLIVNAQDDPMLEAHSYPIDETRSHPHVHLEMPRHGGHLGFVSLNSQNRYWSESRTLEFLDQTVAKTGR